MLENFRLRVFRAVAEQLSFRKASERLYLSQPGVTQQIKALEEELGARLFDRSASGVTLTDAGKLLLGYAERLHRLAEEAEASLASLKGEVAGSLVLGASTTLAQYVLPLHLAHFARRYPAIQMQMFSANTEHVAEGVAMGRFALGLIEGPAHRRDLKVEAWFDDELVLVVPSGHEWADWGTVAAAKLLDVPLVMRERGSGSRDVVEQGLERAGLKLSALHIAMELDSTEAILSCVEAGLGVGIVSKWAIDHRAGSRTLATLCVDGQRFTRSFAFVNQLGAALPAPAAALKHFLETVTATPAPQRSQTS